MNTNGHHRLDEFEAGGDPAVRWTPLWIVPCGKDNEVGIIIDDHCFVVLAKTWADQWMPTSHIPELAVRYMARLLAEPPLSRYKLDSNS